MFATVRQAYAMLQEETAAPEAAASGGEANGGHYLYFQGIPNPPSGYVPPAGASPNTWPAIYNNLQNIDYCTENFSHLGNRIKCLKAFTPGPFLP
mmetsp:Transcript_23847/g.56956  ORF Transcript_23847/g.56956 Transcript_23847/m.56956 type:complete len:95 (+) Transcript_23847:35-319(+)